MLQRAIMLGNFDRAIDLLPDLITNYEQWEKARLEPDGLFWQVDDRDGMEVSVGGREYRGQGKRPTINSYMFGDASAIAIIAAKAGKPEIAATYPKKAGQLRQLILEKLWDDSAKFFKVIPREEGAMPIDVRELHGYTPWYFEIPPKDKGYEVAWKQLMDPQGFHAPYDCPKSVILELTQAAEMFDKDEDDLPKHMSVQKAANVRKAIEEIKDSTDNSELRRIR